tara:strand:- start:405 stop:992 length:588 start_codon:yes stop_codon:yes gene_type:complete
MKIILLIILMSGFLISLFSFIKGEDLYEPPFKLIEISNNIQIREYQNILIAITKKKSTYNSATSSGFRTLANYIFGGNKEQVKMPMTAPVFTTIPGNESISISFVMPSKYSKNDLPKPVSKDIEFKNLELGMTAVIQFGMWATPERILKMKSKLEKYLETNNLEPSSDYLVAQYNSPWTLPPFRRNEILVSINKN